MNALTIIATIAAGLSLGAGLVYGADREASMGTYRLVWDGYQTPPFLTRAECERANQKFHQGRGDCIRVRHWRGVDYHRALWCIQNTDHEACPEFGASSHTDDTNENRSKK